MRCMHWSTVMLGYILNVMKKIHQFYATLYFINVLFKRCAILSPYLHLSILNKGKLECRFIGKDNSGGVIFCVPLCSFGTTPDSRTLFRTRLTVEEDINQCCCTPRFSTKSSSSVIFFGGPSASLYRPPAWPGTSPSAEVHLDGKLSAASCHNVIQT